MVTLLLLAGILAGKVSGRFGIPALLLVLVIDHHLVPQRPTALADGNRLTVLASPAETDRINESFARRGP